MEELKCPMHNFKDCQERECAWYIGSCAIAYIGANCKANMTPWRQVDDRAKKRNV